jgi:DNA-binding MarR family transcriptional regulator
VTWICPWDRTASWCGSATAIVRPRGSEARTLATVGAFRVVSSRDLCDHNGRSLDSGRSDLRHLREEGLVRTIHVDGHRDVVVVLTDRGRELLESHRRDRESREAAPRGGSKSQQEFYADLKKPREVEHDMQVYRAYEREAERLRERGARVERVVLDYELKRNYQRFLQERNRGRSDSDGRPNRDRSEIARWAREHELPYSDGHVRFPDARIEYVDQYECHDHLDIEVVTLHYRGGHGAAAKGSGASIFRGASTRTGGSPFDPDYANEVLR